VGLLAPPPSQPIFKKSPKVITETVQKIWVFYFFVGYILLSLSGTPKKELLVINIVFLLFFLGKFRELLLYYSLYRAYSYLEFYTK